MFCNLHTYTDYSIHWGYSRIDEYIEEAKKKRIKALAITDQYTLMGAFYFMNACHREGIKPIIGVTLPVFRKPFTYHGKDHKTYTLTRENIIDKGNQLVLVARNKKGLYRLFYLLKKASSYSNDTPYLLWGDFCDKEDDLIVILSTFEIGNLVNAKELSHYFAHFYLEYTTLPNRKTYSYKRILKQGIPVIYSYPCHFAKKEQKDMCDINIAIGSKMPLSAPSIQEGGKRPALYSNMQCLMTKEELLAYDDNKAVQDAVKQNESLVDEIEDYTLEYNTHLRPKVTLPKNFHSEVDYFKYLINKGFQKKRAHQSKEIQEASKKEIQKEFEVIYSNDFIGYFLTVYSYLKWSRDQGFLLGPGRGSVGGSEIAYLLDISETDPLRFHLLFDRFLSPGRSAIYEIEYEDGTKVQLPVTTKVKVNGKEKYLYQLKDGDEIEED